MRKYVFTFEQKAFLLLAFVHWVITLFFEKNFFHVSTLKNTGFAVFKILAIVSFWQFVAYLLNRYRKEKGFRVFIYYALGYFIFSLALLVLIWPGIWFWDELNILLRAQNFDFIAWQHVLSGVFYLYALSLFPTPVSIIIFQLFCISLIAGYCVYVLSRICKSSRLALLGFVPFLLPPVILQNYLSYRSTLFSYLLLFLIVHILYLYWKKIAVNNWCFFYLALIVAIISNWRGEAGYLLIAAPLFILFALYRISTRKQKTFFIFAVVIGSGAIAYFQNIYWDPYEKKLNQLVLVVNPLKTLIHEAKQNGQFHIYKNLNEWLDLEELEHYKSGTDALWDGHLVKDNFKLMDTKILVGTYLSLIRKYPTCYLQNRWNFYRSDFEMFVWADGIFKNLLDKYTAPMFQNDPFSHFMDSSLRTSVINTLSLAKMPRLQRLLCDSLIPICLLISLSIYSLKKKRFVWAAASALTLPVAVLVFFTAPEAFFIYYFSIYLVGYVLFMGFVVRQLSYWGSVKSHKHKSTCKMQSY